MGKISKNVIEKIKKKEIKPIPKWQFLLKDSFLRILSVVNIVFGSIGFGIIIYLLKNNDMILDVKLANNIFEWIVFAFPIVWILLTLFFLFVSFYYFKNTEEGYRFNATRILLLSTVISVLFGFILYSSGLAEGLNNIFRRNIPYYEHTMDRRNAMWSRPNAGFLAGSIVSINSEEKIFVLKDLSGKVWEIGYEGTVVKGRVLLDIGEYVKILGKRKDDGNIFIAEEIRPWMGRGMRRMQEN